MRIGWPRCVIAEQKSSPSAPTTPTTASLPTNGYQRRQVRTRRSPWRWVTSSSPSSSLETRCRSSTTTSRRTATYRSSSTSTSTTARTCPESSSPQTNSRRCPTVPRPRTRCGKRLSSTGTPVSPRCRTDPSASGSRHRERAGGISTSATSNRSSPCSVMTAPTPSRYYSRRSMPRMAPERSCDGVFRRRG